MRKGYFIFYILLVCFLILPLKAVILNDLFSPDSILIYKNRMYIADSKMCNIYVYKFNNYRILKKLGKKGEGPTEFSYIPGFGLRMDVINGNVLQINTFKKVQYYTLDGRFIKEIKKKYPGSIFLKSKNKCFLSVIEAKKGVRYDTIYFSDKNQNKLKEIISIKVPFQRDSFIKGFNALNQKILGFYVIKDRIIASEPSGIVYGVDGNGQKIFSLTNNIKRIKFNNRLRNEVYETYKESPEIKPFFNKVKTLIKFPKEFPLIQKLLVTEKSIYLILFGNKKREHVVYKFNAEGKFIRKGKYHFVEKNILSLYPFYFYKGKLYQLIETKGYDNWKIKVNDCK